MSKIVNELPHYTIFETRPDEHFVARWREHLQATGYPETFDNVSGSKPEADAEVVLLSGELTVPVVRRADGRRVPCPFCSPRSPKFKIGRMSWFPGEKVVRFIGHDCARRDLGAAYVEAERRFKLEDRCNQLISRWLEIAPHRQQLIHTCEVIRKTAYPLQGVREQIDPAFLDFLHRQTFANGGRIMTTEDTGLRDRLTGAKVYEDRLIGTVVGLSFIAVSFDPVGALKKAKAILDDMERPLPPWTPGQSDPDAEAEILKRGAAVNSVSLIISQQIDLVREAQRFLAKSNLALLEKWGHHSGSPFASLVCRMEGNQLVMRSNSFAGDHYSKPIVPAAAMDRVSSTKVLDQLTGQQTRKARL